MEQSPSSVANSQFGDQNRIHQGNNYTTLNLHPTYRPARVAIRVIPYPRNEDLIHRSDLVDKLNTLLPHSSEISNSAALWGLGGSGKTQIALNYAYQRCADTSCSVLWVHADTEATFSQDYKTIARKLQIDKSHLSEEDLFEAVRDGIESLSNWVLILDNADDLKLFGVGQTAEETKSLFQYIPHASTGTVLWTTRDAHIMGILVGQGRGIEVAQMRFDEAKQLLMTFGSAESSKEADIESLVKELQLLPLAIMQAGVYMHRASITAKEYLSLLAQSKKRWDTLKINEFNRRRRRNVPNTILETWTISITRIRQESEMTYKILHVIAYVSNENIPTEMITTALRHIGKSLENNSEQLESEVVKIIIRLKEFSFIGIRQMEDGTRNYEMHKLVQEAIRYGLSIDRPNTINENEIVQSNIYENEAEIQTNQHEPVLANSKLVELASVGDNKHVGSEKYFSSIALRATADLFPRSQQTTWKQCEKYLAHALQIGEWADISGKQIETAKLLSRVSRFLLDSGRWREKERVDEKVLKFRRNALGDKHPDTIQAIANLATTYHKQGRYREAEPLDVQVLDFQREILGGKHPNTIQAMHNLAWSWYKMERRQDAVSLMQQALEYSRSTLGPNHPKTVSFSKALQRFVS
ncbi:P-loop containing nucleoside triphosphate hydrolase protein [Trichoderma evansii]